MAILLGFQMIHQISLVALGINTFFTGKDAEDIGINSLVSDNPEYIAAAKIENDGSFAPGDGRNAQEIANLQDNSIDELGDTFNGYLSSLVGEIGIKARGTYRNHDFHNSLLSSLKERRESIQGVSLDEEMTNLIKFQRAYEACIKIMQASDEMFEDLLQIK
ncbi:Flagellar hook-associated protein 1 [Candidatus Methanoperedenaceae archaeon GB50]|nr:Flagellar hook-associated protein 1 [Candidatus Methanoperedenaceae archaeon GB50]